MKLKRLIIVSSLLFIQPFYAQQGEVKSEYFGIGINVGRTIGDYRDSQGSNIGVDIVYLKKLSGKLFFGGATGFTGYFGDTVADLCHETTYDNLQFIPIAASVRFNPFKNFYAGPDIGYAVSTNDSNVGGVYISPRVSYLLNDRLLFYAGYRSISLDDNLESLQFGIGFNF